MAFVVSKDGEFSFLVLIDGYKWVRSLRSLHPLGSLRSLQLLRAWLSLASLAQSHGCDEVGKERD